uniref:(northern house mosquito) hypothetical protein n=1 Tax=Culex pipiens TaxID=7175 RepID=A0A8D8I914_CULPI
MRWILLKCCRRLIGTFSFIVISSGQTMKFRKQSAILGTLVRNRISTSLSVRPKTAANRAYCSFSLIFRNVRMMSRWFSSKLCASEFTRKIRLRRRPRNSVGNSCTICSLALVDVLLAAGAFPGTFRFTFFRPMLSSSASSALVAIRIVVVAPLAAFNVLASNRCVVVAGVTSISSSSTTAVWSISVSDSVADVSSSSSSSVAPPSPGTDSVRRRFASGSDWACCSWSSCSGVIFFFRLICCCDLDAS